MSLQHLHFSWKSFTHHFGDLKSTKSTILRTLIFTGGHYIIDTSVTHFVTGAPWHLALTSSILGPILNAIWYFVLDKFFFSYVFVKISNKHNINVKNKKPVSKNK